MKHASRVSLVTSLVIVLAGGACAGLPAQSFFSGQTSSAGQAPKPAKTPIYAIQIQTVESGAATLPPEFRIALYENIIAEVRKAGGFLNVFRNGDREAAKFPQLVVLHTAVQGFTEGSQRKREVTTVTGATSIKVHVELTGRDGHSLVGRDVEGKVRFFGDNLRATYDLAKGIAKVLHDSI